MKWFRNLKIKVKLISCFIILAMFTGIVGIIGISNMSMINDRGDDMYENNFLPAQELAKVQKNLQFIRVNYYLMLLDGNMSVFQNRMEEVNRWVQENNAILMGYEKTIKSEEEMQLYKGIKESQKPYDIFLKECVNLIQEGKYEEAKIKTPEFAKARAAVDENVGKLMDFNVNRAAEKADQNTKDYKSRSMIMVAVIIIGIISAIGLGLFIANLISKPIYKIVGAANKIADGDLDVAVQMDTKDEVGILAAAFRKMSNNLNEVMYNSSCAAEQVASGSRQVSESSMALSQGATEQASSIEELTASLEEISAQTQENANNANEANKLAKDVELIAEQGNIQMKEMLQSMDEINHASGNISKIIKVIDEIAFQTNILALNAAVEAARAGQHGKGFAVVAEEVRNLAARSASAAKETTAMIESSIEKVDEGTKIANNTASALNKIVEGVAKVANLVGNIAIASNEQALGIEQINQGIMQISEVVQTNSATSQESAAASEELASQAEILKQQVSKFNLRRSIASLYSYGQMESINPNALEKLEGRNKNKIHLEEGYVQSRGNDLKKIILSDKEFGKY